MITNRRFAPFLRSPTRTRQIGLVADNGANTKNACRATIKHPCRVGVPKPARYSTQVNSKLLQKLELAWGKASSPRPQPASICGKWGVEKQYRPEWLNCSDRKNSPRMVIHVQLRQVFRRMNSLSVIAPVTHFTFGRLSTNCFIRRMLELTCTMLPNPIINGRFGTHHVIGSAVSSLLCQAEHRC